MSKDLFGAELEETVLLGFWAKGALLVLLFLELLVLLEFERSEPSTITGGKASTSSSAAEDAIEPLLWELNMSLS